MKIIKSIYEDGLGQVSVGYSHSEQLQYNRWCDAVGAFLSKVCSTIGLRDVPVSWISTNIINSDEQAIAFTDGETIFLNPHKFAAMTSTSLLRGSMVDVVGPMVRVKAAALHELSHILWTPRMRSHPTKDIVAMDRTADHNGIFYAFNILEDSRIENLFVAKYRPAINYFIPLVTDYIINAEDFSAADKDYADAFAFLLLYGRKYMPAAALQQSYKLHVDWIRNYSIQVDPAEFMSIVDEYITLAYPSDHERGLALIIRMFAYIKAFASASPVRTNWGHYGDDEGGDRFAPGGTHGGLRTGQMDSVRDQRKDLKQIKEMADENGFDPNAESSPDGMKNTDKPDPESTASKPASGSTPESDGKTGSGNSAGNESQDSGDEGTGNQANGTGGFGCSTESGNSEGSSVAYKGDSELSKALADIRNEYFQSIESDGFGALKTIHRMMKGTRRSAKPDLRNCTYEPITSRMRVGSRTIKDAIQVIRADGEDVWERGRPHGKFNAGLAMNSRNTHFDVFDQWVDVGDEATSFEVVILLDQSGSMGGHLQNTSSQAMWIIRDAFMALDIPVTVIGYDDRARLLFRPTDSPAGQNYHVVAALNGTDPADALDWAYSILSGSQAAHKFLFSISDGDWHMTGMCVNTMKEIAALGTHSTMVLLGTPEMQYDWETSKYKQVGVRYPSSVYNADGTTTYPTYGHDRSICIANVGIELPKEVAKAITKISQQVYRTVV